MVRKQKKPLDLITLVFPRAKVWPGALEFARLVVPLVNRKICSPECCMRSSVLLTRLL